MNMVTRPVVEGDLKSHVPSQETYFWLEGCYIHAAGRSEIIIYDSKD
jgi:hypothetical protein